VPRDVGSAFAQLVSVTPQSADSTDSHLRLIAWNVSTRYFAIVLDGLVGVVMLPYNLHHLGTSAYGLWMLTASVTAYFAVMDLGYGGALLRFVARYRALGDRTALNEIASTMFVTFSAIAAFILAGTVAIAWHIGALFNLAPEQVPVARAVLLMTGGLVAARFAVSVFGAIVYGFQRYYLNNAASVATTIGVVIATLLVLENGYGLVPLVAATVAVRFAGLLLFVAAGYHVFPDLRVRIGGFRRTRLREVSGFSFYIMVLDWSARLNYSADAIVIGAFLNTTAVALWTVPQRVAELIYQLTNQINDALFPIVVDSDASRRAERLRVLFLQGTRLTIAMVLPLAVPAALLGRELILAWVGPAFLGSVPILQVLMTVITVRMGTMTGTTVLKGAGRHRFLAAVSSFTAVVNVVLSVILIRPFGLTGVAVATLLPVVVCYAGLVFPAACRRVGVPLREAIARAIWPSAWPALVMAAAILALRHIAPPATLIQVAAEASIGVAVYLVVFAFFGLPEPERRLYWSKIRGIVRAPAVRAPNPRTQPASRAGT
jgi:O-antigen/teichoic acid export membrane protein